MVGLALGVYQSNLHSIEIGELREIVVSQSEPMQIEQN